MAGMALLLDTHILLSALLEPDALPGEIRHWLGDPENSVYFSAASIWEIAIKQSLGRDDFDFRPEDIQALALETGFVELPVHADHCHVVARLEWHHRDPFDRLLVAQAKFLPAYLLTADTLLERYSDLVRVVTHA